jgi:hypothetical protein
VLEDRQEPIDWQDFLLAKIFKTERVLVAIKQVFLTGLGF